MLGGVGVSAGSAGTAATLPPQRKKGGGGGGGTGQRSQSSKVQTSKAETRIDMSKIDELEGASKSQTTLTLEARNELDLDSIL